MKLTKNKMHYSAGMELTKKGKVHPSTGIELTKC
jgi:hypothetical protein